MPAVNNLSIGGVVLVEHSDERLAAVEEAKRTGQEFQSVGSKGTDIVDREVLRVAVEEVSNLNSSDPNATLPDYLITLKDNVEDEIELNQQKAKEHSDYSAELARGQEKAAISDAEKLRKDPDYFAKKIAANNVKLAEDHSKVAAEYAADLYARNEGVAEEVRALRPEAVGSPHPLTTLGQQAKGVTDISESFAADALTTKDKIIYGEESFEAQAKSERVVADEAAGEDRAQDASKTDEPARIDEPVRKQKTTKVEAPKVETASTKSTPKE